MRELENILGRALALCEDDVIESGDLQLAKADDDQRVSLEELTQITEREQILNALEKNRWNQSATARSLGITGPSCVIESIR